MALCGLYPFPLPPRPLSLHTAPPTVFVSICESRSDSLWQLVSLLCVPTEQSEGGKKSHDVGSKPSSERGTIKKLTSAMEENVVKSVLAIGAGERDELKKRLA